MGKVKNLPYGISDFERIITKGYYYVDNTMYIPQIENQAPNLFLIRPRRFGKSLFLSMLESYYDVNKADRFDRLFSNLWIGKNPTESHNKFLVLRLDFSRVNGTIERLEERFNNYVSLAIDNFVDYYKDYFQESFLSRYNSLPLFDADDKLNILEMECRIKSIELYLIVDEYDNFTNNVLSEHGENVYHALTHAEGFYRGVFKKFKGMFSRIFMMGVSPVTLDDVTSGFNIGWHISTNPNFNMMLGFSEKDVREMLQYYKDNGVLNADTDIEAVIADMKPWYNNYCFSSRALDDPKMFNCDMTLYYINNLITTGHRPDVMLSPNTKTDYNKMKKIIQLDKLDGHRESVLAKIADDGEILENVVETYPALELTKPSMFVSQLYYYGMLTIGGMKHGFQRLIIPNQNVREQYYLWMLEHYGSADNCIDIEEFAENMRSMAFEGDWRPALEYIGKSYGENSVVRSMIEGERNVQGYMHAYLSLCRLYLTTPELDLKPGFADFFLMPDKQNFGDIAHSYIIELKYVKSDAPDSDLDLKWDEGVEQVNRYAEGQRVKFYCQGTQLHKIVMLFKGRSVVRIEEV